MDIISQFNKLSLNDNSGCEGNNNEWREMGVVMMLVGLAMMVVGVVTDGSDTEWRQLNEDNIN